MHQIEIANTQDCLKIDEAFLRQVAISTLVEEHVAEAHISVAIVDNATIRELNRQYLDCDHDTDVLSFLLECDPLQSPHDPSASRRRGSGKRIEGEVVISAEMALLRAGDFCWSPSEEIVLYLVHGLLHLVGYEDLCDAEKELMRSREQAILKLWKLSACYADSTEQEPVPHRPPLQGGPSGAES